MLGAVGGLLGGSGGAGGGFGSVLQGMSTASGSAGLLQGTNPIYTLLDIGNFVMGAVGAQRNYELTEWQKWYAQNSVAIRRHDLERAGLSPTIAAGTSGSAPGLSAQTMPQMKFDNTLAAIAMLKGQADITQTNAQSNLIQAQKLIADRTQTNIALKNENQKIENTLGMLDVARYMKTGINPRHSSIVGGTVRDVFGTLEKASTEVDAIVDKVIKAYTGTVNKYLTQPLKKVLK